MITYIPGWRFRSTQRFKAGTSSGAYWILSKTKGGRVVAKEEVRILSRPVPLNRVFHSDDWPPRKVDGVLWAVGRGGGNVCMYGPRAHALTTDICPRSHSASFVGLELDVIAAVVIGGTLLTGGVGFLPGTLMGVLILGLIQTLITFQGNAGRKT